ncbi:putative TatD family hydrolase [Seiridium cardinale]
MSTGMSSWDIPTNVDIAQSHPSKSCFVTLGLDYDRLNHAGKGTQITTFKAQLDMFVEEKWDLPLFLYCRASFDDFVQVIGP